MKSVFDIYAFKDNYQLMKCENKEESDFFRLYLHNIGRAWANGDSYFDIDRYEEGKHIYYAFNSGRQGTSGNDKDYEVLGYKIIYFDDFLWDGFNNPIEDSEEIDNFLNLFCTKGESNV